MQTATPLSLQRHFSALTKFAHIESRFCGRKRRGKAALSVPINHCVRSVCSRSVAVGLVRWDWSHTGSHPLGNNNQFHGIAPNSKVLGFPWRDQCEVRHRPGTLGALQAGEIYSDSACFDAISSKAATTASTFRSIRVSQSIFKDRRACRTYDCIVESSVMRST